jgi:hypothetical protein
MRRSLSLCFLLIAVGTCVLATWARAVPSFARQSGRECNECHFSWPELTSTGRKFKLGGYLLNGTDESEKRPLVSFDFDGPAPLIPLAVQVLLSDSSIAKLNHYEAAGAYSRIDEAYIQEASIFLNGQLVGDVGCFCQWTYDGVLGRVTADNLDLRLAHEVHGDPIEAIFGLSLNNNPTVSDIYNTTPAWGWPYAASAIAVTPVANPLINGTLQQSVAGLTSYALIQNTVYIEAGAYRDADHGLQMLTVGVPLSGKTIINGYAPYYRLALQQDWHHERYSAEVGVFGLSANVYPNQYSPFGLTDHYRDSGVDAQYQYVTNRNRFSAQAILIRETKTLDGSYSELGASNTQDWVNLINTKVSYYFNRQYGISAGYQHLTGSSDAGLYSSNTAISSSANGNPDTEDVVGELNYLFSITGRSDYRSFRLVLQYTAYRKFDGAAINYDGAGRRASDNNTIYLLLRGLY